VKMAGLRSRLGRGFDGAVCREKLRRAEGRSEEQGREYEELREIVTRVAPKPALQTSTGQTSLGHTSLLLEWNKSFC
jgi:hypothetical protein